MILWDKCKLSNAQNMITRWKSWTILFKHYIWIVFFFFENEDVFENNEQSKYSYENGNFHFIFPKQSNARCLEKKREKAIPLLCNSTNHTYADLLR